MGIIFLTRNLKIKQINTRNRNYKKRRISMVRVLMWSLNLLQIIHSNCEKEKERTKYNQKPQTRDKSVLFHWL